MEELKESKYLNGKIYALKSHQTDKFYIGSTTQPLSKRLSEHKSRYTNFKNNNSSFSTSFEIIKFDDVFIELIEKNPCNCRNELEKVEGKFILENKDKTVNKYIAGRTKEEYFKDNKEKMKQYFKDYYRARKAKKALEQPKEI